MDDTTDILEEEPAKAADDTEEKNQEKVKSQSSLWASLVKRVKKKQNRPAMYFFQRMCSNISVHGFGLIGMVIEDLHTNMSRGERVFAVFKLLVSIFVLFVSTYFLLWWLIPIFIDYQSSSISIMLSDPQGNLSKAEFPDITICNNNKVKMSFLLNIDKTILKNKDFLSEIDEYFITGGNKEPSPALKKFLESPKFLREIKAALPAKAEMINFSNVKGFFRQAAAPTCKDMILQSYWKNEKFNLTITDNMTEATNFGICCNISPSKLFNDSELIHANPNDGISLLIDSESHDYGHTPHNSEGFKFAVSDPDTFNQVEQDGHFVKSGTNTYVALNPKVILLGSERPVTYQWTPADRKCYTKDMDKMPGMKELQERHPRLKVKDTNGDFDYRLCRELVKLEEINTRLNCTQPELWEIINDDNDTTKLPDLPPCFGPQIKAANQLEKTMSPELGDQLCLRNCENQQNDVTLSFSDYPARALFKQMSEFPLINAKIDKAYRDPIKKAIMDDYFKTKPDAYEYTKENIAWLTVYFKYPYVKTYSADVAKTRQALFSEVGGMCGLFLGISLIGIFELIYHFFKIFWGCVTPTKKCEQKE